MRGLIPMVREFIFGSDPAPAPETPEQKYDDISTLSKLNILMSSPDVPLSRKMQLSAIAMQGWYGQGGLIGQWTGEKGYGLLGYPPLLHRNPPLERRRSRIAWLESVQARELLGSLVDNVIGPGARLESAPKWAIIQPNLEIVGAPLEELRRKWTHEKDLRFDLYMGSKDVDVTGRKTGYQLQRLFFLNYLRDGEVFLLFRYSPDPRRLSPMNVQFVGPDQIINPKDTAMFDAALARGNRIVEGIELDSDNNEIAYFIFDDKEGTTTRVSKYGPKSKRIFMVHALIQEGIGQVRGTPVLSSVVHELHKITDYSVAELESAVVNAMFATWVAPGPQKKASDIMRGLNVTTSATLQAATTPVPNGADPREEPPQLALAVQPGIHISRLGPGEKMESFDTKRPNLGYDAFKTSIMKDIAASTRQPLEVVQMKFDSSYSAAKAAFSLAWNSVDIYLEGVGSDFLDPLHEQWFAEEIRSGQIKIEGLGGPWDSSPVLRRAWTSCQWIGVPVPTMDPTKEAIADDIRIKGGQLTRERAARQFNGSDYHENIRRLKIENEELSDANSTLAPEKPIKEEEGDMPAAPDAKPGGPADDKQEGAA